MQESHYNGVPSTSHVEAVVELPPAPTSTVIGGPSRAPVRSAAPTKVASFKPAGITYSNMVSLPAQSVSGSSRGPAPFNMQQERTLLQQANIKPTIEPLRTAQKVLEGDLNFEEMQAVLKKHKKFTDFATASPIVQNVVASSSSAPPPPVKAPLQVGNPNPWRACCIQRQAEA
jgi:hypothetical protein